MKEIELTFKKWDRGRIENFNEKKIEILCKTDVSHRVPIWI